MHYEMIAHPIRSYFIFLEKWVILFALLLVSIHVHSQPASQISPEQKQLECLYRLVYQVDSTINSTRTELFRLQTGLKASRYESKNAMVFDSVTAEMIKTTLAKELTGEIAGFNIDDALASSMYTPFKEVIFKVPAAKQVLVQNRIGQTFYQYQEVPSLFSWVITADKAVVAGYACQRATTAFGGRIWDAWFSREVPISDGPYKFYGLPGLIIKISDTRNHYVFELISLKKSSSPDSIIPPKTDAKEVKKEDFIRGKRDYARGGMKTAIANGTIKIISQSTPTTTPKTNSWAGKKHNNPLELK